MCRGAPEPQVIEIVNPAAGLTAVSTGEFDAHARATQRCPSVMVRSGYKCHAEPDAHTCMQQAPSCVLLCIIICDYG